MTLTNASGAASPAPSNEWTNLESRVRSLEIQRAYLIGGLIAFAAVLGALGFNAFSYIDEQVRKQIPAIVEERAKQVAQETIKAELPAQVQPAVEQSVQRQFQARSAALNQSFNERLESALATLQLQSAVRDLGGKVVKRPDSAEIEIDLSGKQITKDQLEDLRAFPAIDKVKVLGFQNVEADPNAVKALIDWPGLEKVEVGTDEACAALRKILPPHVKVEVDGKP
jgi:hypothetical protein